MMSTLQTRKEEGRLVVNHYASTPQPREMITVRPKTPLSQDPATTQASYLGADFLALEETTFDSLYGTVLKPDTSVSVAQHYLTNEQVKVLELKADTDLQIHTLAKEGLSQSHLIIYVHAGVQASIVQHLEEFCAGTHTYACEIILEENAQLNFTVVQNLPPTVQLRYHRAVRAEKNAHADVQDIVLGAEYQELTSTMYACGTAAKIFQSATIFGNGNRFLLTQQSHHKVGETESDITTKGVLQNGAQAGLKGLVAIKPKAANSSGYQQMDVLLLDEDSRASAIPELAIQTDEVSCSHGATIGELDEEELFYLMSRGLSKEQATHLLLIGFLAEGISKLPEAQQEGILQLIESRLDK